MPFLGIPLCFVRHIGFQHSRCWDNGCQMHVIRGYLFSPAADCPPLPLLYIFIMRSLNSHNLLVSQMIQGFSLTGKWWSGVAQTSHTGKSQIMYFDFGLFRSSVMICLGKLAWKIIFYVELEKWIPRKLQGFKWKNARDVFALMWE